MDLDNLKQINDEYGHALGDEAIVRTANAVRTTFRDADILCRLGGDEFVVLAEQRGEWSDEIVRWRFNRALQVEVADWDCGHRITASLGFAVGCPSDGAFDLDALIAVADCEMYKQKKLRH